MSDKVFPNLCTVSMCGDHPVVLQVRDLCDEGSHDRWAPTRHNLICGGKSVWEVMRASPDFQNNR